MNNHWNNVRQLDTKQALSVSLCSMVITFISARFQRNIVWKFDSFKTYIISGKWVELIQTNDRKMAESSVSFIVYRC